MYNFIFFYKLYIAIIDLTQHIFRNMCCKEEKVKNYVLDKRKRKITSKTLTRLHCTN